MLICTNDHNDKVQPHICLVCMTRNRFKVRGHLANDVISQIVTTYTHMRCTDDNYDKKPDIMLVNLLVTTQ